MNRNTVRLVAAVVVGWLTAALGGLAVVPYSAFPFVFVAALLLPAGVAFWDSDGVWRRTGCVDGERWFPGRNATGSTTPALRSWPTS